MDVLIAGVTFDTQQRWLQKGDECRHLEPKVFSLLTVLLDANGTLVSRDELIKQVWQGRIVGEGAVNRTISLLRGHFSAFACDNVIETVPTQGYRLTANTVLPTAFDTRGDVEVGTHTDDSVPSAPADNNHSATKNQLTSKSTKFKPLLALSVLIAMITFLFWLVFIRVAEPQPLALLGEPIISEDGWQYRVSASSDGGQILYHHRDKDNQDQIYLYDSRSHESRQILQDVRATLSPDGTQLIYVEEENDACWVRLYTLATKESQALFQCQKWPTRLVWGADNLIYYNQRISKSYPYQVFSFDINTQTVSQISMPSGQSNLRGDFDFAFNPRSAQLAVLRYKSEKASELLLFSDRQADRATPAVYPLDLKIKTLAWLTNKQQLLLASEDRLYIFTPTTGQLTLAGQLGKKINSLAVVSHQGQEQVLVSDIRLATEIFRYDISTATNTLWQTSSRLELLPRFAKDSAALLSTRHESHKLWLVKDNTARLLPLDLPFELEFSRYEFSGDGKKILLSKFGAVYEIDVKNQSYIQLLPESTQAYVVNYGEDDDVIYSSTRSGQWQLWQYRRGEGLHQQLTTRGGYSGRVKQGMLYFSKFNQDGLWRKPIREGINENKNKNKNKSESEEQLIIEDFPLINWLNWQLLAEQIYFYRPASGVWQYHLAQDKETLVMAKPDNFVHQFTVTEDQQQLYWVKQKPVSGDIYRYVFVNNQP